MVVLKMKAERSYSTRGILITPEGRREKDKTEEGRGLETAEVVRAVFIACDKLFPTGSQPQLCTDN